MASGSGPGRKGRDLKFPLFFNDSLTEEAAHGRLNLLEQYCEKKNKNGSRIILLWKGQPNIYDDGITEEMVAAKYLEIAGRDCFGSGYDTLAPVLVHPIDNFGLGVFAEKVIPKGTYIMDYPGFVHLSNSLDYDGGSYAVELTVAPSWSPTGFALDASRVGGVGRFLNHSCDPNVEAQAKLINGQVRVVMLALKDIPPHEQLCWCYGAEYFIERRIPCFCGTQDCQVKPRSKKRKVEMEDYHRYIQEMWRTLPRVPAVPYPRLPTRVKLGPPPSSSQPGTKRAEKGSQNPSPSPAVVMPSTSTSSSPASPPGPAPSSDDAGREQAWQSRSRDILKMIHDDGLVRPDIKLETGDGIFIDAHASVLSLGSPVFHNLIEKLTEDEDSNGSGGTIKLPQINALPLRAILHWLYKDELIPSVSQDLDGVINAALFLQMKELVGILEQRLISEYSLDKMGKMYLTAKEFRIEMPDAFQKISEIVQRDLGVTFASQ